MTEFDIIIEQQYAMEATEEEFKERVRAEQLQKEVPKPEDTKKPAIEANE